MKSLRFVLFTATVVLFSLSTISFAQHEHPTDAGKPDAGQAAGTQAKAGKAAVQKTDAEKSFDQLKAIAGEWEGPITVDPPQPQWQGANKGLHVSLRVTSRGHVVVHELQEPNTPLDYTKYDHPVTMMYLDNDQLNLIHYCDAGNRPHMKGKVSPDGKKIEFDFAELAGSNKYGHMHQAVFTPIDANHHIEEWTWMAPGDKPIHVKFDLRRIPDATVASVK